MAGPCCVCSSLNKVQRSTQITLETAPSTYDNGIMATTNGPPVEKLMSAMAYAALKHTNQRRRDSRKSPYINHPIAVAHMLTHVGKVEDITILQAAVLHDLLEDTDATPADLVERFGHEVCTLVKEVSDDKSLPKNERKAKQIERARSASSAAKMIHIADKICNILDINLVDPPEWSTQRKTEYMLWTDRVVDACRGCNPALEERFDKVFAEHRGMFL